MPKEQFANLLDQIRTTDSNKTIQKVVPESENKTHKKFLFHIETNLFKKLKMKAIEEDKSLKQLANEAIREYLENYTSKK